ncbi:MAG: hypothetical protein WD885_01635, partial [Candidatus Saccharimonadales bacterium]
MSLRSFHLPSLRAALALPVLALVALSALTALNLPGSTPTSQQTPAGAFGPQTPLDSSASETETLSFNRDTIIAGGHSLTATGQVLLQNTVDSTLAFAVQDASGTDLLTVDTLNGVVGIAGSPVTGGATLQVAGNISATGNLQSGASSLSDTALTLNGTIICTVGGCTLANPSTDALTLQGENAAFYRNASNLNAGTLSEQRLTDNVALLNRASQTFSGSQIFQNAADSILALQIQDASGTSNLFVADTSNSKIGIGLAPAATGAILQVAGDIDITGQYKINGAPLSSSSLTDSGQIAYLDADQTFTGDNIFNGVTIQNGNFLFQSSTNSTSAFQVQNAAGNNNLLVADTINTRIGIGIAAPNYTLDVNGDINIAAAQSYRVGGVIICNTTGCAPSTGSSSYVQLQGNTPGSAQSGNFNIAGTAIAGSFYGSGLGLTDLDATQLASGT